MADLPATAAERTVRTARRSCRWSTAKCLRWSAAPRVRYGVCIGRRLHLPATMRWLLGGVAMPTSERKVGRGSAVDSMKVCACDLRVGRSGTTRPGRRTTVSPGRAASAGAVLGFAWESRAHHRWPAAQTRQADLAGEVLNCWPRLRRPTGTGAEVPRATRHAGTETSTPPSFYVAAALHPATAHIVNASARRPRAGDRRMPRQLWPTTARSQVSRKDVLPELGHRHLTSH